MSKDVYNKFKSYGLSGVLNSPNAECVCRLYSHYDWYKKTGQVKYRHTQFYRRDVSSEKDFYVF